jgi:hypothetical protein
MKKQSTSRSAFFDSRVFTVRNVNHPHPRIRRFTQHRNQRHTVNPIGRSLTVSVYCRTRSMDLPMQRISHFAPLYLSRRMNSLRFGRCSVSPSRFRPAVSLKKVQIRSHECQLRNLVGSRANSPFPAAGPAKAPESVSSRPMTLVTNVIGMVDGVPKSACSRKDLFDRSRSSHQRDRRFYRWLHCLKTSSTRL